MSRGGPPGSAIGANAVDSPKAVYGANTADRAIGARDAAEARHARTPEDR